ncbi:MAG: M48 family metalloprotease [Desulfobulbaceae bacterium]|nr:M48 family metalloprotease [Desulfobulbaceae bacterium]HIJ79452.1 M48 family metalloprotease [Deltaproteobacteria bacterium]
MIYNNLIYLLVVILMLTTSSSPEKTQIPFLHAAIIFAAKGFIFQQVAHHLFNRRPIRKAADYFAAEQKLSILAIICMAIDVYLLECLYYFNKLPFTTELPFLLNVCGIIIFFAYLCLIWVTARPKYGLIFGRKQKAAAFVAANLKINLATILPWLLLSLASDLLQLLPLPALKNFLSSPWGEPTLLLIFFAVLVVGMPVILVRMWNCTPLPVGPTRSMIEDFCRSQNLRFAEIMSWPLFEGQMLTAGVMGLTRHFRYLLVTPALLAAMSPAEVKAVMAHEIGHVKRYHLQLYLFLFLGFGMLAQLSTSPLLALLLNSDIFYQAVTFTGKSPDTVLTFASTLTLLLFMLIYFRLIFGFFMRNFERQADLHAMAAMGDVAPLVRVFEKIAWLSGKIRDLPSWHHFGIGERIDFLLNCQQDGRQIARHHRKVHLALALYLLVLISGGLLIWQMPQDFLGDAPKIKFAEALIKEKMSQEPGQAMWPQLLADLQHSHGRYPQAITAYEQAIALDPANAETLNNLAWLLLTAQEPELLNPARALSLARTAADLVRSPHILDTLATAYWANNMRQEAIAIGQEALALSRDNQKFYREQIERFKNSDFSAAIYSPANNTSDNGQL